MSNKTFTEEEIKVLLKNPYVKKVSDKSITYTQNFKEEFMERYKKGELPTEIFRSLGFNTQQLGKRRIASCSYRFKRYNDRMNGFVDQRKGASGRPKRKGITAEEKLARAEEKIQYLQQENEFLKKIKELERRCGKKR